MTWTGRDIARRGSDGRVEVRPGAVRCLVQLGGLPAADAHVVELAFSFSAHALEDRAERQMFAETFLGDRTITTAEQVADHFAPLLRQALLPLMSQRPAGQWIEPEQKSQLINALRAAAKPVAFNCGIELLPPFELAVQSPTLQREQAEQMQRRLAERRVAGQAEHAQRAAELLRQFQSLGEAMPGLSPGQLLDRISPADQGSMLQSLLLAARSADLLWAVAGPALVKIDARSNPPRTELVNLPQDLGPLRSVRAQHDPRTNQPRLLIGAQRGVIVLDPDRPGEPTCYVDRAIASPLGFNSVAATGDMIWATHGQAGLIGWRIGQTDQPAVRAPSFAAEQAQSSEPGAATSDAPIHDALIRAASDAMQSTMSLRTGAAAPAGPRNLVALEDGRVLYSCGQDVFIADPSGQSIAPGDSPVILIAPMGEQIQIVRASGMIDRLDRSTLQRLGSEQRSGPLSAAAKLPWLGSWRLLLATEAGPICCIGTDDPLVTQYTSAHRGLRALAATADLIAALSADRQRILLWNTWDGRQPLAELHIASIAHHRAGDLSFA